MFQCDSPPRYQWRRGEGWDGLSYTEGFRISLTDHPYAEAISYAYGILEEVCLYNFERTIKKLIQRILRIKTLINFGKTYYNIGGKNE